MSKIEIKDSLNLPKTDFSMRAGLPQKEPEILKKWREMDIYGEIRKKRKGAVSWILHDGPPYANGNIHMGHVLNKILKDIVVKSKNMAGFDSPYLPGWDCHGLPIELKVERELGEEFKEQKPDEFLSECRKYAAKYIEIQREEFIRLGIFGEWDKAYKTMSADYEAGIVREIGRFFEKGFVYRGMKPVLWCISCRTALASAEVEYKDRESPSVYIKFPMKDDLSDLIPALKGKKVSIIIWTTTPWTIPANLAITFHPDYDYVAVEAGGEVFIVAEYLAPLTMESCGFKEYKILATFKGKILDKKKALHPFYDRESLLILGEHVTLDAGTGAVHTAPGHGMEDYIVALEYGLDIYNPVEDDGKFVHDLPHFGGLQVFEANPKINDFMREKGVLLGESRIEHSYPHCWRCKNPVIFRATEQWFVNIDHLDLRKRALEKIKETKWIPEWGEERIYKMVANRPDWCISRQRLWGTPLTIFHCEDCGEVLASKEIFEHVASIIEKEGIECWRRRDAEELAPAGTACKKCGSTNLRKEKNIVDVWFDSGVSSRMVLGKRKDLPWPSNMYLEGSDQHRGWFHSALLTSLAITGKAPYREVLTHGFTVDGEGRPLSKNLGNYIPLPDMLKQYGGEILRLWVAMVDYREDIRLSEEILSGAVEAYKKIRNTIRFGLGNLYDFDPDADMVSFKDMEPLDRYALSRLDKIVKQVKDAYDKYLFTEVFHTLEAYSIVDLSSFYFDILKDRLYTFHPEDKRRKSAQSAVFSIVRDLIILLAPILSFTTDEAWEHLPDFTAKEASPHLMLLPEDSRFMLIDEEIKTWEVLLAMREDIQKAMEREREKKVISHSLSAQILLKAKGKTAEIIKKNLSILREILIVSSVRYSEDDQAYEGEKIKDLEIGVYTALGKKCERCWNYSEKVGENEQYPSACERCVPVLEKL